MTTSATARAPGTTGNAAVGFDVLGFASDVIFDTVTVRRIDEPTVRIASISAPNLPTEAGENTAGVALMEMRKRLHLDFGFEIEIEKGIPLGSGLGGSAASAVGAVVAANALLDQPVDKHDLFRFALAGEAISSGHAHPDNVAPCLYGGLTLTTGDRVQVLPTPDLEVALVHPDTSIKTRDARAVLPTEIPLSLAVSQMAHLAAFVDACHRNDAEAAGRNCRDLLVEPHRKALLPGFDAAKTAAYGSGAVAFSLSGSGPTVFALTPIGEAESVARAIAAAFNSRGLQTRTWTSAFGAGGAEVL